MQTEGMSNGTTSYRTVNTFRIIWILLLLLVLLFLAAAAVVGFGLPHLVSSNRFHRIAEERLSSVFGAALSIEKMEFNWSRGLQCREIAFSTADHRPPIAVIRDLEVRIFPIGVYRPALRLEVECGNTAMWLEKGSSGRTNLDPILQKRGPSPSQRSLEAEKTLPGTEGMALPIDISAQVLLKNVVFSAVDHLTGKKLSIEQGFLDLQVPSLLTEAIQMHAGADCILNGKRLPRVAANVTIASLVQKGAVMLHQASCNVDATAPGIHLSAVGNPVHLQINGELEAYLPEVRSAIRSFMPDELKPYAVEGKIRVLFDFGQKEQGEFVFRTDVQAEELAVSHEAERFRQVGPVTLSLKQSGNFSMEKAQAASASGDWQVGDICQLKWSAMIDDFAGENPNVAVTIGPVHAVLLPLYKLVSPLLPAKDRSMFQEDSRSITLSLEALTYSGDAAGLRGQCSVHNLLLEADRLSVATGESNLTLSDMLAVVKKAEADISEFFPTAVTIEAASAGKKLLVENGEPVVSGKGLQIKNISIAMKNIAREKGAMAGVTADVGIEESIQIEEMNVAPLLSAGNIVQHIDIEGRLLPDQQAVFSIREMGLHSDLVKIADSSAPSLETAVELTGHVQSLHLESQESLAVDFTGAELCLVAQDFLQLIVSANAIDLARERLETEGRLSVDLSRLADRLPTKWLGNARISGRAGVQMKTDGRLPNDSEKRDLKEARLGELFSRLNFIDRLEVSCEADAIRFEKELPGQSTLSMGPFSGNPVGHYVYDGAAQKGWFEGKVFVQKLPDFPGMPAAKPLALAVSASGRHDAWKAVYFDQEFTFPDLRMTHSTHAEIYGIDRILRRPYPGRLFTWMMGLGGGMKTRLRLDDISRFRTFKPDWRMAGAVEAGMDVSFDSGREARGAVDLKLDQVTLEPGARMGVRGLEGRVQLDKQYRIVLPDAERKQVETRQKYLSAEVLGEMRGSAQKEASVQTNWDFLSTPEEMNAFPDQWLVAEEIWRSGGPLSISAGPLQLKLGSQDGLPQLLRFQTELLGGSVVASAAVKRKYPHFFILTRISFSGIDTGRAAGREKGEEAAENEISGHLFVEVPVTRDPTLAGSSLLVDLTFSQIGPRAMERLLYAIDPLESNETIVSQRRLLKKGFPRRIHITIKEGNLSLAGEVAIGPVTEKIPPLERLSISNLQGFDSAVSKLTVMDTVSMILEAAGAEGIQPEPEGSVRFVNISE